MSALPLYLGDGLVAVYGVGSPSDIRNGVVPPEGGRWGTVYQIWDNGNVGVQLNDTVIFKEKDVVCRLAYTTGIFTIFNQAAIIVTEEIIIDP